jgi:hypothetical protein
MKNPRTGPRGCGWLPATKADLREMEARLTVILMAIAEGDKQRISKMIEDLKNSANTLREAVNKNQ